LSRGDPRASEIAEATGDDRELVHIESAQCEYSTSMQRSGKSSPPASDPLGRDSGKHGLPLIFIRGYVAATHVAYSLVIQVEKQRSTRETASYANRRGTRGLQHQESFREDSQSKDVR